MATQPTQCPYCRYTVIVNVKWARKNGRVFCGTCCKSFEVHVGEEEKEDVINQDAQGEVTPEPLEKKLQALEDEIDQAIEEYRIPDTDDYWY